MLTADSYILICHGSYEDRSLVVGQVAIAEKKIIASVVIYSNGFLNSERYERNVSKLLDICRNRYLTAPIEVSVSNANTVSYLRALDEKIGEFLCNSTTKVLVDITTFPRDRLLCLFDYLYRKGSHSVVEFIYAHPQKYDIENEEGWLSQGVGSIKPILGFHGLKKTRRQTLLVMLVGGELERARTTLGFIEPDKLILMCSGAVCENRFGDEGSCSYSELISGFEHAVLECCSIDYMDYSKVQRVIDVLYERYSPRYNIIVTTNGSKIQALGVMLACQKYRDIEVKYAYPQVYNTESYSNNLGDVYLGSCDMRAYDSQN